MKKIITSAKNLFAVLAMVCLFAFANNINAQNCVDLGGASPSSSTQNFDNLGTSPAPQNGSANQVIINASSPRQVYGTLDNAIADSGGTVNVQGWALYEEGANTSAVSGRYNVGDGSSSGGNGYSFGTTADRAFGSVNDSNLTLAYVGGCYRNATGSTITSVQIGFTGEMWRYGNSGTPETLEFQYAVNPTDILNGTYTDFNSLDFTTPNMTGTAGARDGNLAANRTVVSPTTLSVTLNPNDVIFVRWCDVEIAGNDDGLAIDDFNISLLTPTAADTTVSGRILSSSGRAIPFASITVYGLDGTSYTTSSNPFGYYRFENMTAGESYIFNIHSKRFRFSKMPQTVTVLEDIAQLNFIADN